MAITITNVSALVAVHSLQRNQTNLQKTLMRLSTGLRINSAADDPAGLIASISLQAEEATTKAGIANAQRDDQILATAEGGLAEVSNLLISLQGLVTQSANSAGLSSDEIDANQLQVDSILSSINRISNATTFGGRQLLDGELAYRISGGPNAQALQNLNVHSAQVGPGGQSINVQVLASAQHATLIYHGQPSGLYGPASISLGGVNGSVQLSFASATSAAVIASSINQFSTATGVTASASGNDVALVTTGYGSKQFVSVQSTSTAFQTQTLAGTTANQSAGRDATVTLNGQTVQSDGLSVSARGNDFDASFSLDPTANTTGATSQFTVTGGGATFSLDGNAADTSSIALSPTNTAALGFTQPSAQAYSLADLGSGGAASLKSGHLDIAQQIVSNAIREVSQSRASIGAYRAYDIQSTINSLNVKLENLSSAESNITDADFATETANLAREQILAQSSQMALSAAEQNQQIILKLLGA